jgi:hypothetical protein
MTSRIILNFICGALLLFAGLPATAAAQTGSIHGTVTDPSGAVIPASTVTLSNSNGFSSTTTSGGDGTFAIDSLEPGRYFITATAEGFAPLDPVEVQVFANKTSFQKLALKIAADTQQVNVTDEGMSVDTSAANNANSMVI